MSEIPEYNGRFPLRWVPCIRSVCVFLIIVSCSRGSVLCHGVGITRALLALGTFPVDTRVLGDAKWKSHTHESKATTQHNNDAVVFVAISAVIMRKLFLMMRCLDLNPASVQ